MGKISVIIGQGIVVVSIALYPFGSKIGSQGKAHVILRTALHGKLLVGDKSRQVYIFAVTGGGLPQRHVIIVKYKARMDELIQGRCQIFVHRIGGKSFRRQENQVVALKHTGIFVSFGGRHALHVIR